MIRVRLMTLTGKFTCVREERCENASVARELVERHAATGGYTNVQLIDDDDPGSFRYTARTPGGRGGRNIAYAEVEGYGDFR